MAYTMDRSWKLLDDLEDAVLNGGYKPNEAIWEYCGTHEEIGIALAALNASLDGNMEVGDAVTSLLAWMLEKHIGNMNEQ